MAQNT